MRIYLIRHGETAFNEEKRYQGSIDVPLSQKGRSKLSQAEISVKCVYTSCMKRTIETAQILFPKSVLVPVCDLREMSFGDYEGCSRAELENDEEHSCWLASGFTGTCPNQTESHQAFVMRTAKAFVQLVNEELATGEDGFAIVAHGGTQMAVMSSFVGGEVAFGDWLSGNGGGYILDSACWCKDQRLKLLGKIDFSAGDEGAED